MANKEYKVVMMSKVFDETKGVLRECSFVLERRDNETSLSFALISYSKKINVTKKIEREREREREREQKDHQPK